MKNNDTLAENKKRKLLNKINNIKEKSTLNSFDRLKAYLEICNEIEEMLVDLLFEIDTPQYSDLSDIQNYINQLIKEHIAVLIQSNNSPSLYYDLINLSEQAGYHSEHLSVVLSHLFFTRVCHHNFSTRNIVIIHFDEGKKLLIALDIITHSVIQIINGDLIYNKVQKMSVIKVKAKKILHPEYANAYVLEKNSFTYLGETKLSILLYKMQNYGKIAYFTNQGFKDLMMLNNSFHYYILVRDINEEKVIGKEEPLNDEICFSRILLFSFNKSKKNNHSSLIMSIDDEAIPVISGFYTPSSEVPISDCYQFDIPSYEEVMEDELYYSVEDEYDDQYAVNFDVVTYKDFVSRVNYRDTMLEIEGLNQLAGTFKENSFFLQKINLTLSSEMERINEENEKLKSKIKIIKSDLESQYCSIIKGYKDENENLKSLLNDAEIKNYEVDRLREFIFQFQCDGRINESESINKLIEEHTIIIIGGNENWRKKVKDIYPQIRTLDSNLTFELSILDSYDFIFFNVYGLSHAAYYRAINYIRKRNLKYDFIYATNLEIMSKEIYKKINKT